MAEEQTPLIPSSSVTSVKDPTASAASLLRDAILLTKSIPVSDYTDNYYYRLEETKSDISHLCRRILNIRLVSTILNLSVYGLIFLSFIEPPFWCRTFNGAENLENGCDLALKMNGTPAFYSDDTEKEIQDFYPNAGITILSLSQSLLLERLFIFVIVTHTVLAIGSYNFSFNNYFAKDAFMNSSSTADKKVDELTIKYLKTASFVRVIRLIFVLGLISRVCFDKWAVFPLIFRMIVFITFSDIAQQQFSTAVKLIPHLLPVSSVFLIVIIFYAFIGVTAFYDTKEGSDFFGNIVEAMWTLWTSATSVIYPDVMMSAYNENRFTALYFVSYMMLTFFFFMNVLLALVYAVYENVSSAAAEQIENAKKNHIRQAFEILDTKKMNYISRADMIRIISIFNEDYDDMRIIPEKEAQIMLTVMDPDGLDRIDLGAFMNVGTLLLLEFQHISENTWFEEKFPEFTRTSFYQQFSSSIKSNAFEFFIDFMILLNTIVVVIQCFPQLVGHEEEEKDSSVLKIIEAIFTMLYVWEMTTKILVIGWKQYTSSVRHVFDGFITILSLTTTIVVYYPNKFNDPGAVRSVVVLRVFRVFRLFMAIKPFQIIGGTFVRILPSAGRLLLLLFCVMYIFSAIGMHFFGGLITRDPTNDVSYFLEGTDFADSLYWANNFNDLSSGMNVMFNMLVINNWNELETGILAVSQTKASRLFFLFFYICGVILVNNLVIALIIDTFMNELKNKLEDNSSSNETSNVNEKSIVGKSLVVDAEKLGRGNTDMNGRYLATLHTHGESATQRKLLSDLFVKENKN